MAKIPKTEIGCLCSFHNILFTNKIKSLFDVTVSLYLHIFICTLQKFKHFTTVYLLYMY
ncbi:unknown [Clostridium sp. CAG:352]|nr:unknown [Clostridium sp. CAG:352]SCJ36216.1 Uncharacterised protein [uncultured Ruminococcus sp.]